MQDAKWMNCIQVEMYVSLIYLILDNKKTEFKINFSTQILDTWSLDWTAKIELNNKDYWIKGMKTSSKHRSILLDLINCKLY